MTATNDLTEDVTNDPRAVAETYFDSWLAKDFDRFRSILAEGVTFTGPLGQTAGIDETVQGIEGMSRIVTDIKVLRRFVAGDDVLTWFELHTTVAPPAPTANWSHVVDGKVTEIRATFDPRPLLAG